MLVEVGVRWERNGGWSWRPSCPCDRIPGREVYGWAELAGAPGTQVWIGERDAEVSAAATVVGGRLVEVPDPRQEFRVGSLPRFEADPQGDTLAVVGLWVAEWRAWSADELDRIHVEGLERLAIAEGWAKVAVVSHWGDRERGWSPQAWVQQAEYGSGRAGALSLAIRKGVRPRCVDPVGERVLGVWESPVYG